jgi:hypothetical protein
MSELIVVEQTSNLQGEPAAKRERKENKRVRRRRQALRLVVTNCWVRNSAFFSFFLLNL